MCMFTSAHCVTVAEGRFISQIFLKVYVVAWRRVCFDLGGVESHIKAFKLHLLEDQREIVHWMVPKLIILRRTLCLSVDSKDKIKSRRVAYIKIFLYEMYES